MQITPHPRAITPFSTNPPENNGSNNNSSSSANTASITANDFLQLLVTEMRNQDPTTQSDPNEYINQLVQVNSLEQLIEINQDLGGGGISSSGDSASVRHAPTVAAALSGSASGNLATPIPGSAAVRLAEALGVPATGSSSQSLDSFLSALRSHAQGSSLSTTNPAR